MHYLVSCSICKDEDDYILDFIEYNKFVGIEHFIIYDRSKIPLEETLKDRKDVTIIRFPEPNKHAEAWLHCINNFQGFSKWCMFFDIDQFVMLHHHNDMKVLLQDYEDVGGLGINWLCFGNNNHIDKPSSPQLLSYTKRNLLQDPVNSHIQSCCQLDKLMPVLPGTPHHLHMNHGFNTVNEKYDIITTPTTPVIVGDKINLAHFYTRSFQEWNEKVHKRRADTNSFGRELDGKVQRVNTKSLNEDPAVNADLNYFYDVNKSFNDVEDFSLSEIYKKYKGI